MRSHTRPSRTRSSSAPVRRADRPAGACAAVEEHAAQPGLSVVVRQDVAQPVVTVAGELDLAGAGLVTAMLDHVHRRRPRAAGRREQVDVDLAGVTFVDSHGLAAVVDGPTRIVASSEPVRRLLHLLDDVPASGPRRAPDGWAASA